eukprot:c7813_g1_i1.p1 GENE.c7813_g1_i1~~c7813_g1_i1.p1  ORF type:complete len:348 (+),score=102.94 c7813_g1_i1:42-1046(+)
MSSSAYSELAQLHASVAKRLADVTEDRNFLRKRISALTGEVFPPSPPATDLVMMQPSGSPKRKRVAVLARKVTYPEDFCYGSVRIAPEVFGDLEKLFQAMDTSNRGFISQEDFSGNNFQDLVRSMGTWGEIQNFFDEDRNGLIDPSEFIKGFWKWALPQQIAVGGTMTFQAIIQQVEAHVNAKIRELVMIVRERVATMLKHRQGPISWATTRASPVIHGFVLPVDLINLMSSLFGYLDDKKVGEITMESFFAAPGMAGLEKKLGTWQELTQHFDTNHSGSIDQKEFVLGFLNLLRARPTTIAQGTHSIKDLISSVDSQAGALLTSLLSDFKQSI